MADNACPGCGQAVGAEELFCPHCGAAQVPQYTRTQLNAALGREREAGTMVPAGLGCGLGLLAGLAGVLLLDVPALFAPQGRLRYQQQGEFVGLTMLGGLIVGLLYRLIRTAASWRRQRHRGTGP
jgi:hypothetical protein